MAVACWSGRPCIAAGSAPLLGSLVLPAGRRVKLYANAGDVGVRAALRLARRHGEHLVEVLRPQIGRDPAEALVAAGGSRG